MIFSSCQPAAISFTHCWTAAMGHTTRHGPFKGRASNKLMAFQGCKIALQHETGSLWLGTWIVLPMPISSARMPPRTSESSWWHIHARPVRAGIGGKMEECSWAYCAGAVAANQLHRPSFWKGSMGTARSLHPSQNRLCFRDHTTILSHVLKSGSLLCVQTTTRTKSSMRTAPVLRNSYFRQVLRHDSH